jgi:hypothetical protein
MFQLEPTPLLTERKWKLQGNISHTQKKRKLKEIKYIFGLLWHPLEYNKPTIVS